MKMMLLSQKNQKNYDHFSENGDVKLKKSNKH